MSQTVVVLEPNRNALRRVRSLVEAMGHTVVGSEGGETALGLVTSRHPFAVVASLPSQEKVIQRLRQAGMGSSVLILSLPAKASGARETSKTLGADAFIVRPYRWDMLASTLHSALALWESRKALADAASRLEQERARVAGGGQVDPRTNFYHFDFFKRMLLFELLRAKRYGYELAVCLIALDPQPSLERLSPEVKSDLEAAIAVAIRGSIRDIDIPVHYTAGKYLLFLPHTDAQGAERVGRRINQRLRKALYRDGSLLVSPTASVGIAGLRDAKGVSFSRLMRDAQSALKAAQLKGGNQVVLRG